ncbi:natural killer cells antigen CD94-like [Tachyglossus aculeatus]|uniref:natural killer cells antigen CD94-like n=1 Tax=Tachyglossus aculeatus TaxID=9261 RepID=UPI0018F2DB33|nr:natural killer cells antigen CD94-like [Tachyglossus aculeatus]
MSEQNLCYGEMNPPQKSMKRRIQVKTEDSSSAPWCLLAGTLGVLSLVLVASVLALGVLMRKQSSNQGSESPSSLPNTTSQRGCYFGSCAENWIWSRGNCYYVSKEFRTWSESQTACRSMNSSLLKVENREELQNFLKLLASYYWIGLSRNGSNEHWLWEDRSDLSRDLSVQDNFSHRHCVYYYALGDKFSSENCLQLLFYICELRAT